MDASRDYLDGTAADSIAAKSGFGFRGGDLGDMVVVEDVKLFLAAEFFAEGELHGFIDGGGGVE